MSDAEHAAFWNDVNCARWSKTVGVEESTGLAVCDTDPLKLHYDYCLARVGATDWGRFDCGVAEAEKAIAEERLGIADLVVVHLPDDETLARQRESDRSPLDGDDATSSCTAGWVSRSETGIWRLIGLTLPESAGASSTSIRRRLSGTDSTEDCSAPGWLISRAEKAAHNDYPPAAPHPALRGTVALGLGRSVSGSRSASRAQNLDVAIDRRSVGQAFVRRHERAVEGLGERHVTGVVRGHVRPKLEGPGHQDAGWESSDGECEEVVDGGSEAVVGEIAM